jgi:hypothetical protein
MILHTLVENKEISSDLLDLMIKGSQQTIDGEHWLLGAIEAFSTWTKPYLPSFGILKSFVIMLH